MRESSFFGQETAFFTTKTAIFHPKRTHKTFTNLTYLTHAVVSEFHVAIAIQQNIIEFQVSVNYTLNERNG